MRLICIADLHCGNRAGLTPPNYQRFKTSKDHILQKFSAIQTEGWRWYQSKARQYNAPDILVLNGDGIDGRGERSGGVELITLDRNEQIEMALECIRIWNAKHIVIVRGTPYHAGEFESWEDLIARELNCKVGDHEWIEVEGVVFDFKHFIGGSIVPYGRKTAISRDELWNLIWAEEGYQPRADWIVRSHVHYCEWGGRIVGKKEVNVMITPALQAMGSRYGARQCSGIVHFGFVGWDINDGVVRSWKEIAYIQSQKAHTLKF